MNYELALQLKNAGFPKIRFTTFTATGSDEVILTDGPNLSELIEACGDRFDELSKYGHEKQRWSAFAYSCEECDLGMAIGRGDNKEEAVAKLWLAINK